MGTLPCGDEPFHVLAQGACIRAASRKHEWRIQIGLSSQRDNAVLDAHIKRADYILITPRKGPRYTSIPV